MSITKFWKRTACATLVLCSAAVYTIGLAATLGVDPNQYLSDIKFLSSPDMKGRATGSPELEKASAWIASRFKEFGLKTSLQAFPVTTEAALGKGNQLRVTEAGHMEQLKCPEDFVPFNFSSSAKVAAPVVFAGYGITAPEYKYDDYAGIDVKGKIVVVLRHEPQENDAKSVFEGKS